MQQDPGQGDLIKPKCPVEYSFRNPEKSPAGVLGLGLQEQRAHHRGRGKRNHHRNQDGHGKRHRKLAEKPSDEAAHEQDRREDGNERNTDGKNGEADLLGAPQRRVQRRHALLEIARDVLDDHDGIVDHEAGRNRQGHEREIVEAEPAQVHHTEGADEGDRHRDAGDEHGAEIAKENEDDQDNQGHGDEKRALHIPDGGADRRRLVHHDVEVHASGNLAVQLGQDGVDPLDRVDDVGPGLLEDNDEDRRLAVRVTGIADVFHGIRDLRDIPDANRGGVGVSDDQRLVLGGLEKLVVVLNGPGAIAAGEVSLGDIGVRAGQRRADGLQADPVFVQRHGIQFHADAGQGTSADDDLSHAGDLRELLGEDGRGRVVHLSLGVGVGSQRHDHDGRIGGIDLPVGWIGGKVGREVATRRVDGRLHVAGRAIDVPAQVELQGDTGRAEVA